MTVPAAVYIVVGVDGIAAGTASQLDDLGGPLIALAAVVTAAVPASLATAHAWHL